MTKGLARSFLPSNRSLLTVIIGLSVVVTVRLFTTAAKTDNWPGFWYSLLHVVIVAVGSYLALRHRRSGNQEQI